MISWSVLCVPNAYLPVPCKSIIATTICTHATDGLVSCSRYKVDQISVIQAVSHKQIVYTVQAVLVVCIFYSNILRFVYNYLMSSFVSKPGKCCCIPLITSVFGSRRVSHSTGHVQLKNRRVHVYTVYGDPRHSRGRRVI